MSNIKDMYFNRNVGEFPETFEFNNIKFKKKEDLRYGTNPHQPAAIYEPENYSGILGKYEILKQGKSGLSQTNIEDINHAAQILKFFSNPACVVMKHLNPSGVACLRTDTEPLSTVYFRARDCDAQAAFGSTVVFNTKVDNETAVEIMQSIVENVAAPDFEPEAIETLKNNEKYGRNKQIRVIKIGDVSKLPKYIGDNFEYEIKVLSDGSMILAAPYLSSIKTGDNLILPKATDKTGNEIEIANPAEQNILNDLLLAWYVCAGVRSNAVVIVKDGVTLAIGTGEQDRVGAVSQAIEKSQKKFKGPETLSGASIASDGFFPFSDSIELIAKAGIKAIIQPGGSVKDYDVIKTCNQLGVSMYFTGERCFAHH